jgi:hypothetical protein
MSKRAMEWVNFSARVINHIEDYTVPQYGDLPDDQVSEWTAAQCVENVKRYCNRFGKGQRGSEEELRDLLKMAHYACLAYSKSVLPGLPQGREGAGNSDVCES